MCDSVVEEGYQCPKCGADVINCRLYDDWGWFSDDEYYFNCVGKLTGEFWQDVTLPNGEPVPVRNRSCGYFRLEDLAVKNKDEKTAL